MSHLETIQAMLSGAHDFAFVANAVTAFGLAQEVGIIFALKDAVVSATLTRWRPYTTAIAVVVPIMNLIVVIGCAIGELVLNWRAYHSETLLWSPIVTIALRIAALFIGARAYLKVHVEVALEQELLFKLAFRGLPSNPPPWIFWLDQLVFRSRLEEIKSDPEYSAYLRNKEVTNLRLDSHVSSQLISLHGVACAQEQWKQLFALFDTEKELQVIFKRELEHPVVETDKERAWFGIWSKGSSLLTYAGVAVVPDFGAVLWVEIVISRDHIKSIQKIPEALEPFFQTANSVLRSDDDRCSNLGHVAVDGNTYFAFARPLAEIPDPGSDCILQWFKDTILAGREFVLKHCL